MRYAFWCVPFFSCFLVYNAETCFDVYVVTDESIDIKTVVSAILESVDELGAL